MTTKRTPTRTRVLPVEVANLGMRAGIVGLQRAAAGFVAEHPEAIEPLTTHPRPAPEPLTAVPSIGLHRRERVG